MASIGVIGSGSWGTAIAWLLSNNGHKVTLWAFAQEEYEMFMKYHENTDRLPGVKLSHSVSYTMDLAEAVKGRDLLVCAVPSPVIRSTAHAMKDLVEDGQIIVTLTTGIEESTLKIMTDVIEDEIPQACTAVLSGPSHAEEVGRGLPTTIVVAAKDEKTAAYIQKLFNSPVFRVYTSTDMLGVEIGAALKNVIALAAGMADGLGYGDNSKAALITRGITEITRLGVAMGARKETFFGLSGIGDLIVTCASVHSRNRKAGFLMGQGMKYKEAMEQVHQVVEGVYSAKAAYELAGKYGVEMPIVAEVNKILFEGKSPRDAVDNLMQRELKQEGM
ncbi:MAG: NAD(P)H-dependent glycerol-3-phosphate dehydrogenase [Lachnospiraceae bacterium]|nr:NAD(P)H-dependent glycerol-3-phosphate dehydrogenase [Lachnospiraceae bacterium]